MIKDLVVNLTGGGPQDFAADYAVSIAKTFGAHRPARTTVQVAALPHEGLRVEIDAIAYVP